MRKTVVVALFVTLFLSSQAAAGDFTRFSSNPIKPLTMVGIAMSEDTGSAKATVEGLYKKQLKVPIQYPVFADPTYKQLKADKAFDVSFFGKSASGRKFESTVDTALGLNANHSTIIVTDRQKRVRALSQVTTLDVHVLAQLIEELLLNIEGKEKITVDSQAPDGPLGWQTDLGKETWEKKRAADEARGVKVIDFGAGKKMWHPYIGQPVPDVKIKTMDGADTTLHEAINGKVSLIVVFAASADPFSQMFYAGSAINLGLMDQLYKDFTLQQSKPGKKFVENALPDAL